MVKMKGIEVNVKTGEVTQTEEEDIRAMNQPKSKTFQEEFQEIKAKIAALEAK